MEEREIIPEETLLSIQNNLPKILYHLNLLKNISFPPPLINIEDNPLITFILEQKLISLRQLIQSLTEDHFSTGMLRESLISYLDHNILKVENHLLQIDYWQNHGLHKDVIHLRAQMQQQLFQLEQEKVRAQISMNSQILQLQKESRVFEKELNDIKSKLSLFRMQNGGYL